MKLLLDSDFLFFLEVNTFSIQTLFRSQQTVTLFVLKLHLGDTQDSEDLPWVEKETTVFHTSFTPSVGPVSLHHFIASGFNGGITEAVSVASDALKYWS